LERRLVRWFDLVVSPACEVDRGVQVAVDLETTVLAEVDAFRQQQGVLHLTATGARLRRREPPVGDDELDAVPPSLVLEQPSQVAEPCIGDRLGEGAELTHTGDVEVLDDDPVTVRHKPGGDVVCEMASGPCDPRVDLLEPGCGLGAAGRSWLGSR
jgi:hypothetical protein